MDIESKYNLISTGSIIVLATIGSFVTSSSSAYVLGLSIGLQQPVYEFFELKDYLEVTPVWLLPTAIYLLIMGFVLLFLPPIISIRNTKHTEPGLWPLISFGIIYLLPGLLLLGLSFFMVVNNDLGWGLASLHFAALFGLSVAFLVVYQKRVVGLEPEQKGLRFVLMTNIIALFVALSMGYNWGPRWVRLSRASTVIVGDDKGVTKDQEIHGYIVLHLERYLILQDESDHLVAISTSQIKRIDSPPPSPAPSPASSPTPDSNSVN